MNRHKKQDSSIPETETTTNRNISSHTYQSVNQNAALFQEDNLYNNNNLENSEERENALPKSIIYSRKRIFSLNSLEKLLQRSPKSQKPPKKHNKKSSKYSLLPPSQSVFASNPSSVPCKPNKLLIDLDSVNKRLEFIAKNEQIITNKEKSLRSEKSQLLKAKERLESQLISTEDHNVCPLDAMAQKLDALDQKYLKKKLHLIEIEKELKRTKIEMAHLKEFQNELVNGVAGVEKDLEGKENYLKQT